MKSYDDFCRSDLRNIIPAKYTDNGNIDCQKLSKQIRLLAMSGQVVEIAKENGWSVSIISNDNDNFTYEFSQYSPAGQDFSFCADMEDNNIYTLIDNILAQYHDYDCSEEAYVWLDDTGHGINGAPYDMKDVYEDMEACQQMMIDLYHALSAKDWSEYYE